MNKRPEIESICKQCKKRFYHRTDHPNKYCSRQCAGKAKRHTIKCKVCGEKVKRSRNVFCSQICAMKSRSKGSIITILCDECGVIFSKHKCHLNKNNFCSRDCAGIWQSNHRSGKNHPRSKTVGTEIKKVDSSGRGRMWVKVAHPNVWVQRARYIYEEQGFIIPNGKIIHHKDGNTLNDDLDNLMCVTRKWHINYHRKELTIRRPSIGVAKN